MQPRELARPSDLKRKREAFEKMRTTTHNASSGVQLFAALPRSYSKEQKKDLDEGRLAIPVTKKPRLDAVQTRLFGL
jgi:hypothetical protein